MVFTLVPTDHGCGEDPLSHLVSAWKVSCLQSGFLNTCYVSIMFPPDRSVVQEGSNSNQIVVFLCFPRTSLLSDKPCWQGSLWHCPAVPSMPGDDCRDVADWLR